MLYAFNIAERMIDFAGGDFGDKIVRQVMRCMDNAMANWPALHEWTYYFTLARLQINAPYSTGTVEYVSSTRTLTLTGGTWPTWAAQGTVSIQTGGTNSSVVRALVSSRDSTTVLTLREGLTLGTDAGPGLSYVIYQEAYDLPEDFLATDNGISNTRFTPLYYVRPQSWMLSQSAGTPAHYTIMPSLITPGRYAIHFAPYPDQVGSLDYMYLRRLGTVTRYGYESYEGSVGVTTASAAITGNATRFNSNMIGSYLMVSESAKQPDGTNRPVFTSRITAVGSSAAMTVADVVPANVATASGLGYRVTDAIDVDDPTMGSAFWWQCALSLANDLRLDSKVMAQVNSAAQFALTIARESDSRVFGRRVVTPGGLIWGPGTVTGPDDI